MSLRRLMLLSLLMAGVVSLNACASTGTSDSKTRAQTHMNEKARFEQLLNSRGAEYEALRQAYFADPALVAYLPERFDDGDKVTAFIARQLHLWATDPPPEFSQTEVFLKDGIFADRERMSRTAGGWRPASNLSNFLAEDSTDRQVAVNFLMLHVLMDRDISLGTEVQFSIRAAMIGQFWRSDDSMLSKSSSPIPLLEPEALIRCVVEAPETEGGKPYWMAWLIDDILPRIDRQRAIAAIEHERAYAQRHGRPFPQALIDYREQLRRGR